MWCDKSGSFANLGKDAIRAVGERNSEQRKRDMLQHAFKEWAVICRALAEGKQAIVLRKGGVDEDFRLERRRFWFFPTYVHQQRDGIRSEAATWLDEELRNRPPDGTVRLSRWAEVEGIWRLHDVAPALLLGPFHFWSEATVRKRFEYREPGLTVFAVRVWKAPHAVMLADSAAYQGCRSWVSLDEALPTEGSTPAISDAAFRDVLQSLDRLLAPTSLA